MIITVDPSQSEDIAAFAMVKQYRMQALNVTLNGGTGSSAWQAVQGGEGYTQTVVTPVTGIELVYEDPNAIVSYTVENDDTSNYDAASNAGIILSSIEPTTNAWTYTCVFHADSVPVSSVDIDLLVYGNIARGTEQQGSPATAEEITAQVLAGLETRVTALEEEMPDKADKATTLAGYGITDAYTKTEADTLLGAKANDNAVVHLAGAETIPGAKTFTEKLTLQSSAPYIQLKSTQAVGTNQYLGFIQEVDANNAEIFDIYPTTDAQGGVSVNIAVKGNGPVRVPSPGSGAPSNAVATIATLDGYLPMVRTTGNQTIGGTKTFTGTTITAFIRTSGTDGYRRINIDRTDDDLAVAPQSSILYPLISWNDRNNNLMSAIYVYHLPNGTTSISVQTRNSDGSIKYTTIAQGDVIA